MKTTMNTLGSAGRKAALGMALIVCGCASDKAVHGIPNFAVVEPGIYRGGQPTTAGWSYLQSLGIRRVVKLNTAGEGSDAEAWRQGMTVESFPITFCQQTFGKPGRAALSEAVDSIQTNTFIHCTHGQDRTGLVVGAYRVRVMGWSKHDAYADMTAHGFHPLLRGLHWSWEEDVP